VRDEKEKKKKPTEEHRLRQAMSPAKKPRKEKTKEEEKQTIPKEPIAGRKTSSQKERRLRPSQLYRLVLSNPLTDIKSDQKAT